MPTQTPNYLFYLPVEGGDKDTWGGYLNENWSRLDDILTETISRIDALEQASYVPIGGLYFSSADNDPATTLGYGTWEEYAAGRAIVGVGDAGGGLGAWYPGQTLGTPSVILSEEELPPHNHLIGPLQVDTSYLGDHAHGTQDGVGNFLAVQRPSGSAGFNGGGNYQYTATFNTTGWAGGHSHTVDIPEFLSGGIGSGYAHNNIQESIGVYVWRRTA